MLLHQKHIKPLTLDWSSKPLTTGNRPMKLSFLKPSKGTFVGFHLSTQGQSWSVRQLAGQKTLRRSKKEKAIQTNGSLPGTHDEWSNQLLGYFWILSHRTVTVAIFLSLLLLTIIVKHIIFCFKIFVGDISQTDVPAPYAHAHSHTPCGLKRCLQLRRCQACSIHLAYNATVLSHAGCMETHRAFVVARVLDVDASFVRTTTSMSIFVSASSLPCDWPRSSSVEAQSH